MDESKDMVERILEEVNRERTFKEKLQLKTVDTLELIYGFLFRKMKMSYYISALVIWTLIVTYIASESHGEFIYVSYYHPLCKWLLSFVLLFINNTAWDFFSKKRKCLTGMLLVGFSFWFWTFWDIAVFQMATWFIIRTTIIYIIIQNFVFYIIGLIPRKVEEYFENKRFDDDKETWENYYQRVVREYPRDFKMSTYQSLNSRYHFSVSDTFLNRVQLLKEQDIQQEYALAKEVQYVSDLYHQAKNDSEIGETDAVEWNTRFNELKDQVTERLEKVKTDALVLAYLHMAYFSDIPVKIHSFSQEEADEILLDKVDDCTVSAKTVMDFIISELAKSELTPLEQMDLLSKFNKLVVTQITNERFIKKVMER